MVWEPLGTDNIPGNPWRGVPNYNGYQPNASGQLVYTEPNYLDVDKPFVTYPPGTARRIARAACLTPHLDLPVLSMTSQNGGADWSNHGYSPRTNLYYIPYGVAPVAHDRRQAATACARSASTRPAASSRSTRRPTRWSGATTSASTRRTARAC